MKKAKTKKDQVKLAELTLATNRFNSRHVVFLVLVSFGLYFNTLFNDYTLDDFLVITQNTFTQKGIAGIPDLVTKPSYYGFFKNAKEEVTLRYRPLVMISYALECEFIKNRMLLLVFSHLVNILIFTLSVYLLYRLFNEFLFAKNKTLAFLSTLLFAIHPIHTESVANIKGRDELFSFLFAVWALFFLFKFLKTKNNISYLVSLICFLGGLFSKESTIAFVAVIPICIYFFSSVSIKKIVQLTIPYFVLSMLYVWLRFSVTGWFAAASTEVLNNPFLLASASQKYATIIFCLGYYLRLLIFPHPLSYDYTFAKIELTGFDNPLVWLSLIIHSVLIGVAIAGIKEKRIFSFAILFYFATLILVSNLFVNLGAFIGERLVYTPSLGFCIAIALLLQFLYQKLQKTGFMNIPYTGEILLCLLVLTAGYKIITRNADWKNNFTLMTHDVHNSSKSMKANDAAAIYLILESDKPGVTEENKKELLERAIFHDHRAAEILPSFTDIYLNLGASFSRFEMVDSAEYYWNFARKQKPGHQKLKEFDSVLSILFLKRGLKYAVDKDMEKSIVDLNKAVKYDPLNLEAWYNYAGACYSIGNFVEAKRGFVEVLKIDPGHAQAQQGLNSLVNTK